MAQEESTAKGFMIGLLTGGLIGAAIALLYAPKSGRELRADIKNKAGEIADDAEQYLTAAKHKAVDIINEGKKKSDQRITDAREKAQTLLTDAERILTDAREKAGTVMEEGNRIKNAVKAGVNAYKDERNR